MMHEHLMDDHDVGGNTFPRETAGLPEATEPRTVTSKRDELELRIAPVAKRIGQDTVRMLAYNGSIPGPTIRVREGADLDVLVRNDGDLETTVHWHGLRLENRYDGTHETQAPIPVGGSFRYRLSCPDPGVYWYHPHVREDYGQELGQYGVIVVEPRDPGYWPRAHRELVLTLDDVLIEDGAIAPFLRSETTHAAMGRFGNVLLVAGLTDPSYAVRRGEVVRLYLVNTANARVFNVTLPGARMKLVGGDSGRCEREQLIDSVVLAPSERVVVDVCFDRPGRTLLEHRTPQGVHELAAFAVEEAEAVPGLADGFGTLRTNGEWAGMRAALAGYVAARPEKTLAFVAEMDLGTAEGAALYACPMHPDVTSGEPDRCPRCGMRLVDAAITSAAGHTDHGGHAEPDADGIEWEDDMAHLNRLTTPANTRWMLVDRDTGESNHEITWRFAAGDRVKVRLVNEMESDHPMHHPFHVHGAGRFVVLARDGEPEPNLVWKDTVLVRAGETVDILLELTNPGRWMAHCHIAEHHESGMMFSFDVDPARA
jgi:FtsP/CotA-like multicopper oxidase with cupredoxin domain